MLKKMALLLVAKVRIITLIPAGLLWYFYNLCILKKQLKQEGGKFKIEGYLPLITDRYANNGSLDKHYFLQDIYMARKIIESKIEDHFDVGSRVDGFVAHVVSGINGVVTLLDIRPMNVKVDRLRFIQTDATNLIEIDDNSIESISSLHAIEHFGLGRYSDKVYINACFDAMKSLQRVLAPGGRLYFSVPIGNSDVIIYNSHRQFRPITILNTFDKLNLIEFSCIHEFEIMTYTDNPAELIINEEISFFDYDCGMFIFEKVK